MKPRGLFINYCLHRSGRMHAVEAYCSPLDPCLHAMLRASTEISNAKSRNIFLAPGESNTMGLSWFYQQVVSQYFIWGQIIILLYKTSKSVSSTKKANPSICIHVGSHQFWQQIAKHVTCFLRATVFGHCNCLCLLCLRQSASMVNFRGYAHCTYLAIVWSLSQNMAFPTMYNHFLQGHLIQLQDISHAR